MAQPARMFVQQLEPGTPVQVTPDMSDVGYIFLMNTGTNPLSVNFGSPMQPGDTGLGLDPPSVPGGQGGSYERGAVFTSGRGYEQIPMPIYALSSGGSSLVVLVTTGLYQGIPEPFREGKM